MRIARFRLSGIVEESTTLLRLFALSNISLTYGSELAEAHPPTEQGTEQEELMLLMGEETSLLDVSAIMIRQRII